MATALPQAFLDDIKANALKVDPFKLQIEGIDFPAGPTFPPGELDRLKAPLDEDMVTSICKHGVIRHVIVRKDGEKYIVVDGRRRVMHARAASLRLQKLGQEPIRIPASVVRGDELALFGISRIANAFALLDPPITNAKNAQWALDKGASIEEVALSFGVKPVTITDWLKLLDLAPEIQVKVENKEITTNAGLELAPLSMADQVKAMQEAKVAAGGGKLTTAHVTKAARETKGQSAPVKKTPSERVKAAQALIESLMTEHVKASFQSKKPVEAVVLPPPSDAMFVTLRKIALALNDRKWDSGVKAQLAAMQKESAEPEADKE